MGFYLELFRFHSIEKYGCRPLRIKDSRLETYMPRLKDGEIFVFSNGIDAAMVVEDEDNLKSLLRKFPKGGLFTADKLQLIKLNGNLAYETEKQLASLRAEGKIEYSQV